MTDLRAAARRNAHVLEKTIEISKLALLALFYKQRAATLAERCKALGEGLLSGINGGLVPASEALDIAERTMSLVRWLVRQSKADNGQTHDICLMLSIASIFEIFIKRADLDARFRRLNEIIELARKAAGVRSQHTQRSQLTNLAAGRDLRRLEERP